MSKVEEKNQQHAEPEAVAKPKPSAKNAPPLEALLGGVVRANEALFQGLSNLTSLPEISGGLSLVPPVYNKPFKEGVMGFRSESGSLGLTVACGTAQVRSIPLGKFVALIEKMHDPDRPTIVLQSPVEQDRNHSGRGQLLGRIIPTSSALVVGLGYSGRIVEKLQDFVKVDVYYLSRSELTAFYIAAKVQLSTENTLNELITAYEGWYKFGVPLDPSNPQCLEDATIKASF